MSKNKYKRNLFLAAVDFLDSRQVHFQSRQSAMTILELSSLAAKHIK